MFIYFLIVALLWQPILGTSLSDDFGLNETFDKLVKRGIRRLESHCRLPRGCTALINGLRGAIGTDWLNVVSEFEEQYFQYTSPSSSGSDSQGSLPESRSRGTYRQGWSALVGSHASEKSTRTVEGKLPYMYSERYHLAYDTLHNLIASAQVDSERFFALTDVCLGMLERIDRQYLSDNAMRFYTTILGPLTKLFILQYYTYG
jgi:hypothetical protein